MIIQQKPIPALGCPGHVKNVIRDWSGIECNDVTLEQLAKIGPYIKNFVVDEFYFLDNMEKIFQTMNQNGIKGMVIYGMHIFKFNNTILERLDELSVGKSVHFITMSYKVKTFRNVIAHTIDLVEHSIAHEVNHLLAERCRSRRSPEKDFILMVNTKNKFRQDLVKGLEQSGVLKNSVLSTGGAEDYKKFTQKQNKIFDWIEQQLPGHISLGALRSWGIGNVPNFQAYEKTFCDIVVESANTAIDHTHDNHFSDLSEKTYKPIALGTPFVFLGSKDMYQKLIDDGYRLVDEGDFYMKWHTAPNIEMAVSHLVIFLKKIMVDKDLRERLESMASHNYKNFWTDRKLVHQTNKEKVLNECFGTSTFNTIYDCFDF